MAARPKAVDCSNPGYDEMEHLDENLGALAVELTSDDLREIDSAFPKITVQGIRLPEEHMKLIDR